MKRKSRAFYTWNQTILCKYLPAYIYGTHVETRVTRSETLFVLVWAMYLLSDIRSYVKLLVISINIISVLLHHTYELFPTFLLRAVDLNETLLNHFSRI